MGLAIYGLQSQLGTVISLVLCIPLGIVIYVIAIFVLRVVKEQDLTILKGIQDSLPPVFRKSYAVLIRLVETIGSIADHTQNASDMMRAMISD